MTYGTETTYARQCRLLAKIAEARLEKDFDKLADALDDLVRYFAEHTHQYTVQSSDPCLPNSEATTEAASGY